MLELNSRTELARPQGRVGNKERRRLLIALVLLLVALGVVLVKDREFWFGSDEALESDAVSETVAKKESPAVSVKTGQVPAAKATTAAATAPNHLTPKTSGGPATKEPSAEKAATPESPVVVTHRAILPPLDVEVVAGDTHRTIHPGSNVAKVEIPGDSNRASAGTMSIPSLPANAAARERLAPESAELRQPLDSTYPLLGRHSRVQGSVVLQAVVGADGAIVDLRVLSGPAILTAAAQQAVRQWRFKPYLQNGQPVETKAKITVNFSIRMQESS